MRNEISTFLAQKDEGTLIHLHVQPRAARTGFGGVLQGRLKLRVCAPPVEGEANRECIGFLSGVLGVPKSEITLVRGGQSRQKTLFVPRSVDFVRERLKESGVSD